MPLARILTFDPDAAADFAQQLQQLGFQVEVVNPNEQQVAPADLEIEFAVCDQQQVLGRASAIAAELQAQVIVFPGAVPPLPKPISTPQRNERLEPVEVSWEEQETMTEQPVHQTIHEDPDFSPPIETAGTREDAAFTQLAERLRAGGQRLRVALASAMARLKTTTTSAGNAVAGQCRALQEVIRLRVAHARAAWERRLAEIRRQRVEAAERAAALKLERHREAELAAVAREQERQKEIALAAAQQQELLRLQTEKEKLLAEIEQLQLQARGQSAAVAEAQHQQHPPAKLALMQPLMQKMVKAVQRGNGQLRGALAGALAATALFLVGMIWANLHTMTPLSHTLLNGSVEEQVPFGAATVHGAPAVKLQPLPVKNTTQQSAPLPAKPQPARTSGPSSKPDPRWHHFQRASSDNEDSVTAPDVVVRHFGPPRRLPTQTATAQQRTGIKRYSDE
jgi:hypothetical protein